MKKIFFLIATFGILLGLTACNVEQEHTHTIITHEAKEATCTEHGYKAYEECTECDYTTYVKIDALGHELTYYELNESTCIKNGTEEYWYCTKCGYYFTDEKGTQSIDYEDLIISNKEHIDENKDHVCDYGCSVTIGTHTDSNSDNDHVCDYGCGVTLEDCYGGTATCISKAECEVCGNGYGDFIEHNYKYEAGFHSVTETCTNGCNHHEILTITVPDAVYTGKPIPIEVVCTPDFKGNYTLTYNTNDSIAPKDAGIWEFTLTVGDVTITDSYEIKVIIDSISSNYIDYDFGDGWSNETHFPGVHYTGNIQDVGKTAWEEDDQIIVTLTTQSFGSKSYVFTFKSGVWTTDGDFVYTEREIPTISAIYAPCYEVVEGVMQLKEGMNLGMTEYIEAVCDIDYNNGTINISFPDYKNYSRIRIIGEPGATYTINTIEFTPAGSSMMNHDSSYTLTADKYGNMYLYGIFAEGSIIDIPKGEITLESQVFYEATEVGKSYVVDARVIIDGTLGFKETATEEDIDALVEQLKSYVDNGITTINVEGEEPALIEVNGIIMPAVSEAIYRLSGNGYYDENNQYNGKIDLILQHVTEIREWEFYEAYALNSITLPKVTKIGDQAFQDTRYLRTITFGSVLTEVNETNGVMFYRLGEEVGGCDLILNCGQMNESSVPTPDLTTNTWKIKFENEFNSITLIHTGENSECDEC